MLSARLGPFGLPPRARGSAAAHCATRSSFALLGNSASKSRLPLSEAVPLLLPWRKASSSAAATRAAATAAVASSSALATASSTAANLAFRAVAATASAATRSRSSAAATSEAATIELLLWTLRSGRVEGSWGLLLHWEEAATIELLLRVWVELAESLVSSGPAREEDEQGDGRLRWRESRRGLERNISKLSDEWFADEEKVRDTVGLLLNGTNFPNSRKLTCGICFEGHSSAVMSSAGCAHFYCHECWEGYISAAISDGPGCLSLRCPDPSCGAMVLQDMINKLAKDDDRERYARFVLRAYVEDSKKTKWCPAPDCTCAVEFLSDGSYDVSCNCKFSFCWNCSEEAHRPVNCETVSKWVLKNSAESENMNWILANSKPCPKCKRPIEKNQGCMHMTCTPPCKFEFCWLCLGSWAEHGERTGGFYACNRYESAKKEGVYDETEARRERAKNSLERYMHYYERWASNQTVCSKYLSGSSFLSTITIDVV
ncbi:hypothetical protein GUJ93_ZPchr0010g10195 [Zizania palustris]|uniref:RBR-type E3 ubiquitin transferase n=1 Tax=Zizania palustris TaxID=103762 RepID=A0A8J6BN28_ZIZPA|nr:hypothetical protein GUJ93_ZPchr0010g10195 [Zizania palustris]